MEKFKSYKFLNFPIVFLTKSTLQFCLFTLLFLLHVVRAESELPSVSFTTEPSNTIVGKGSSVWLDCAAEGNPLPLISWRKDYVPLNFINDPNRKLFSNGTLFISIVSHRRSSYSDAGTYQCVAESANVGKIISRKAKLSVAGPPDFEYEPEDVLVFEEEIARFSCSFRDGPTTKISWFWNSRPLILDSRMTLLPSGALEIQAVTLGDQGEYYCSASYFGKPQMSRKAILKVERALALRDPVTPFFIAKPESAAVKVGQNVSLECAANGYPSPVVTWLKDGASLDIQSLGSRYSFEGSTRSLLLTDAMLADEGSYMCRAENKLDSVDAVAQLSILDAPEMVVKPEDVSAQERADVQLNCAVSGRPKPTITWMKDAQLVKENEYRVISDGSLKILGVVPSDRGMYQCFASNEVGEIQASARLTVRISGFTYIKNGLSYSSGDTNYGDSNQIDEGLSPSPPRHLEAVIKSSRFVTLSWLEPQFNNDNIVGYSLLYRKEDSERERIHNVSASSSVRIDVYKTQIGHLSPNSAYLVRVVAYTSDEVVGKFSKELRVKTAPDLDLPGPPLKLRVVPSTSTSISVSWEPPSDTETPLSGYVLSYVKVGSAEEHHLELLQTSYELRNLEEFTEYSFWLMAVNKNGRGDPTHEVTARTFSAAPSGPPRNFTAESFSSRSLILRWEPPELDKQNGVITGYKIRYKEKGSSRAITKTADGTVRLFHLSDLQKDFLYAIKLSAMTVNGSGPATAWTHAKTLANDLGENRPPGSPASISAIPFKNSIEVNWHPPTSMDVLIKGYRIGWGKGVPDEFTAEVGSNLREYTIKLLEPNAEYVITVLAFNSRGPGLPIYEQVRTLSKSRAVPATLAPPIQLEAEALTSFTVSLRWIDTKLNRNQFIGDQGFYVVRYTTLSSASSSNPRYKYMNVSDVTALIAELQPATTYEFSVKAIKGRRESPWSFVVIQKTLEARPSSPPRDVTVITTEEKPSSATFHWSPPRQPNGEINGYLIYYTTNLNTEWSSQEAVDGAMTFVLSHLIPDTFYYYKMQAKNQKGLGPFSSVGNFTTLAVTGLTSVKSPPAIAIPGNSFIIFVIGGVIGASSFILVIVALFFLCRRSRNGNNESVSSNLLKKGETKPPPPDLWIHHDHLELKNLRSGNREPPSHTLPQLVDHHGGGDLATDDRNSTFTTTSSTLDRRTPFQAAAYLCDRMADDETDRLLNRRPFKPKPLVVSVASAKDSVIGGSTSSSVYGDGIAGKSNYSTSQYTNPSSQGYVSPHGNSYMPNPDSMRSSNKTNSLGKRLGNPLLSFSVPAPPQSVPTTPQQPKDIGSKSLFKALNFPPSTHSDDEPVLFSGRADKEATDRVDTFSEQEEIDDELMHGSSTEELTQEMANLEGLMKDLSAIQANQFNC